MERPRGEWFLGRDTRYVSPRPPNRSPAQTIKHPIPYTDMRDTALYYPLRKVLDVSNEGAQPGLKKLAKAILDRDVQTDIHCPVSPGLSVCSVVDHPIVL